MAHQGAIDPTRNKVGPRACTAEFHGGQTHFEDIAERLINVPVLGVSSTPVPVAWCSELASLTWNSH